MHLEEEARPSTRSATETTAVLTRTLESAGDRSRMVEPLYGARLGRFVLAEFLGEGASGRVYVAHDTILDRAVAIKLLRASASDAQLVQERLLGEARALARLSHTNVVQIYDIGVFEGRIYLALEYVDGVTLRVWQQRHADDWRAVVAMYCQCGEGLAAAHNVGLVHRDFKPENVMVSKDGRTHVLDFGLAGLTEMTSTTAGEPDGQFEGTPGYMAPEQYLQHPTSAGSDQFSFCVALYEALYQVRPFAATTIPDQRERVLAGELPTAPVLTSVPPRLMNLLRRGLSVDPEQRWPDMQALLVELKGCLRPSHAHGLFALAAATTMVLLLVAGVAGYRRWDVARRVAACQATGAEIDAVWNDEVRERLRTAFMATGVNYAGATVDRVMPRLDEQAAAWKQARTEVCLDTDVRARWGEDLADRAVWCLEDRHMDLASLIDELGRANATTVQKAVSAVTGLRAVATCLDEGLMQHQPAPPTSGREAIQEVRAGLSRALSLELGGDFKLALATTTLAREQAEAVRDWPPLLAAARTREGYLLERSGAYDAAETASAAAYFEAARSGAWEVAANAANDLVFTIGFRVGRHREGRIWAQHAKLALELAGDPEGLSEAQRLNNLATVHFAANEYAAARPLFERTLAIRERALGSVHPEVAISLNNVAAVLTEPGDFAEARALNERALAIREQALGSGHPDVAMSLNNLAVLLRSAGELAEALTLNERALDLQEQAFGPDNPDVATTTINLAKVHQAMGAYDLARPRYERALAILEQAVGPDHREYNRALLGLGNNYVFTGAYDLAQPLLERGLGLTEKSMGPTHPSLASALNNLGEMHRRTGEYAQARALLERAITIQEQAKVPGHRDLARSLEILGEVFLGEQRPAEALPLFERAMAIYAAQSGAPPEEPVAQFGTARTLVAAGGDRARALDLARAARDNLRRKAHPSGVVTLAEVEQWLATHEGEGVSGARRATRRSARLMVTTDDLVVAGKITVQKLLPVRSSTRGRARTRTSPGGAQLSAARRSSTRPATAAVARS